MSGGLMSGGRMSGGRMSGGRLSGGLMSGGLMSAHHHGHIATLVILSPPNHTSPHTIESTEICEMTTSNESDAV